MADEYINELEINGQKRLDLTQDTATPETVFEGETFHLRSGAPATGTYRPSNEIEARLRATVGHSSKNLLDLTKHNPYASGITVTSLDVTTGTIVANATGAYKTIIWEDTALNLPADKKYIISLSNNSASTGSRLSIYNKADGLSYTKINLATTGDKSFLFDPADYPSGYNFRLFLTSTNSSSATGAINISSFMIRDGSISDDSFEPYQIPTDELITRLDQRIYELERANENPPDPDEGQYFITVFNNSGSDCDIWLTTPIADGGAFYDKYVYSHWVTTYHRSLDYCGKRIMVLFRAGVGDIVMTLNSSQSGQGRFYKQFDVDEFLDMCDVKDGSSTNYISIHLCDDGGIRNQAEYEAYIGG